MNRIKVNKLLNEVRAKTLFDTIKHGKKHHRRWLRREIAAFYDVDIQDAKKWSLWRRYAHD